MVGLFKEIHYKRVVSYNGKNGWLKCKGIDIMSLGDYIRISPLTSRGLVAKCHIDVPVEEIDNLINELQKLKINETNG